MCKADSLHPNSHLLTTFFLVPRASREMADYTLALTLFWEFESGVCEDPYLGHFSLSSHSLFLANVDYESVFAHEDDLFRAIVRSRASRLTAQEQSKGSPPVDIKDAAGGRRL